jgi:pimeloyl-ACP methyl ester carboxylesterase
MHRRAALRCIGASLCAISGAHLASAQESSPVEERWSVGGLIGTFTQPAGGPARGPAALILAGSGPTPRDGNFGTYRRIAQGLAANGIRSLRYDKRGVGESGALVTREEDLLLQHYVDDAVSAVRDLEARPDVSAVVIIGHSEGALLAILTAKAIKVAGIVLLAGPGRRFDAILREQLAGVPLPPDQQRYRKEAFAIIDALAKGQRVAEVSKPNWVLFRPSVQLFFITLIAVDPAAEFSRLTVPALIVQGARDIQVKVTDYEALRKARPDATSLLLPDANHMFTRAPANLSDRAAQVKSYDPKAPLVPDLMPALVSFIKSVSPGP